MQKEVENEESMDRLSCILAGARHGCADRRWHNRGQRLTDWFITINANNKQRHQPDRTRNGWIYWNGRQHGQQHQQHWPDRDGI
jgi:hypothetical protein